MAKFGLQLQNFLVVFIFFVIVINKYVFGTSAPQKICREDHDIFDNPTCRGQSECSNCTGMNAYCNITEGNSSCLQCTCFGEYRTYLPHLRPFGRCVKDKRLLFLPASLNSFLIQEYQLENCITYNRSNHLTIAKCNSSDPSQKWIWTLYNQILHVNTLKCIQSDEAYLNDNSYIMNLGLKKCNILEMKQKWKCNAYFLETLQTFFDKNVQQHNIWITYTKGIINAKTDTPKHWKRRDTNKKICSSSFGCDEFAHSSSGILVLDKKSRWKGKRRIAVRPETGQCKVDYLQFWEYESWKRLEFTNEISFINDAMNRTFLKWNLKQAPSNWSNLIIKLNFNCTPVSENSTKASAGCVLIKLKYTPQHPNPDYRTTTSTTQAETSPTGSFTSTGILDTSPPSSTTNTKSPTERFSSTGTSDTSPPSSATNTKSSTERFSSTGTLDTSPPSSTTNTKSSTESFTSTGTINTSLPSSATKAKSPTSSKEKQQAESSSVVGIVVGLLVAILVVSGIIIGFLCYKRRSRSDKTTSKVEINGKEHSSGDTQNPIYSSEDKDSSLFINDGGIYEEPDENLSEASQTCGLYESVDDRKSDYPETKQENKPAPSLEELEYDYATNDDVKLAAQRLPAKGNNYHISNTNPPTNPSENKETEDDNEVLYHTLEDDAGPVYQTLEDK